MTLPLSFGLVEQFPQACKDQKDAKHSFQHDRIQPSPQQGKPEGSGASGNDGRKYFLEGKGTLLPPKDGSHNRAGNEKQKIDPTGGVWIYVLKQGQPENQQTASADSQARQKSQHCSDEYRYHSR